MIELAHFRLDLAEQMLTCHGEQAATFTGCCDLGLACLKACGTQADTSDGEGRQ